MNAERQKLLKDIVLWTIGALLGVKLIMGADWESTIRSTLIVIVVSLLVRFYTVRRASRS